MDIFSALAEPTRRAIVELLAAEGQLSASQIAARFPVSAPAISQHLKALREAQLVWVEVRAQQRLYRLNPAAMRHLELWARGLQERLEEQFDALDRVLAAEKQKSTARIDTGSQPAGTSQEAQNEQAESDR